MFCQGEAALADQREMRIPIYEDYGADKTTTKLSGLVSHLLATVPAEYLRGLHHVTLTSFWGGNREVRKRAHRSRGRKVRAGRASGLYTPRQSGSEACIVLYVDILLKQMHTWWSWLRPVREIIVGQTLFHELGHHVHHTIGREYREKEDVADEWCYALLFHHIQRVHPLVWRVLKHGAPLYLKLRGKKRKQKFRSARVRAFLKTELGWKEKTGQG